jgi:GTPase
MTHVIAIVGRPNVGKSTLFNRLSRSRDALVDDQPGITRDRLYTTVFYEGASLTLVDTGGFDDTAGDPFSEGLIKQVGLAIEEADRIIFMVDARQGLMPGDRDVADKLRRSRKEVFLVINKVDGPEQEHLSHDFYSLGIDQIYSLSAAHGYGVRSFLGDLIKGVPVSAEEENGRDEIRVAVIGRPNTGKSSLINKILGHDRLLVSDLPGTTRDAVDTPFTYSGKSYLLIDTAGIRRKGRVTEKIEKFSVVKALKSLDRCHIAVILLDASEGVSEQDARICGYAFERRRGMVLAINKWDLVKKDPEAKRVLNIGIDRQLQFISFAPRVNLSALTGERVMKVFDQIDLVYSQYSQRFNTAEVNQAIQEILEKHPPPRIGKGRLKVFYATQSHTKPPTFVLFLNRPEAIHFSYERFLSNQLKEYFPLHATPIKMVFRKK